jgi:hypothetical protein
MPGKFDMYFAGTSIGEGQYNKGNPGERLVHDAWENSARRDTGSGGYYMVVHLEGPPRRVESALGILKEYAETCIFINTPPNEVDRAERHAAKCFLTNLETAIKEIC